MEKIILFISALLFGYFNLKIPMYVAFLAYIYFFIKNNKLEKEELINHIIILSLLFSLFLPDNYLVIAIIYVSFIYLVLKNISDVKSYLVKNKILAIYIIIYLLVSTFINGFSLIKFIFAFMYLVPTFLLLFSIRYMNLNMTYVKSWIKPLLLSQYIAVISYCFANYKTLKTAVDFDWVTGTLGLSQCNILCIICLVSAVLFFNEFIVERKKSDLFYLIISLILAVFTSSIAILLMFIGIVTVFLFLNKTNLRNKAKSLALVCVLILGFTLVTPQWMKNDIANFTDLTYVEQRVGKIKNYRNTFIEIPQKYFVQSIIGTGVGNYSSRTALTCTGYYIGFYNKLFPTEISMYTRDYILQDYTNVLAHKLSTLNTPFSSIITIQGEFGFIGTLLFLKGLIEILKNSNKLQKMIVLFFVSILFIENYIEFAKVISIFTLCYPLINRSTLDC